MDTALPHPGPEVSRLLEVFRLDHGLTDEDARLLKVQEAQRILSHGPVAAGRNNVGLALGYVQSGKTMSFTTLAALAADTGYRLIVLLLGNTHLLVGQNTNRLLSDLRIRQRDDYRWAHLPLPRANTDLDFLLGQDDRVVLITLLKHATRINAVAAMAETSMLVDNMPCLVIDDEADQASLNAGVRKGRVTPTHRAILRLKNALANHLYVQYTATPFAPLLLEPHDSLSPEFLEVLTPGEAYTGGQAFFIENRDSVVRDVGEAEAEDKDPKHLPHGLRVSASSFLVGTAMMHGNDRLPGVVSMMIHTSGLKVDHAAVARLVDGWLTTLRRRAQADSRDVGWLDLLAQLQPLRADFVAHGCPDVSDTTFSESLAWAIKYAKFWVVNSDQDFETIDWKLAPVHLLVGGNKLDRGFTVRGLTHTYMTRKASQGQADTIEQRARCYGYKHGYINYCRFFGPTQVVNAFTSLVHTESDMRASLIAWKNAGLSLSEWSANHGLLLPGDMKPTRPSVLKEPYSRSFSDWSYLRQPSTDLDTTNANQRCLEKTGVLDAVPVTYGEVHAQIVDGVATETVLEEVMKPWKAPASAGWDAPLLTRALARLAEAHLIDTMTIMYLQRKHDGALVPRQRKWDDGDGFVQLMQGSDKGTEYPGDRYLRGEATAQLQAHRVVRNEGGPEMLALAIFIPRLAGGLEKEVLRSIS